MEPWYNNTMTQIRGNIGGHAFMKTAGIGKQDFASLREKGYFYVDKTAFIRDWWNSPFDVTLITRPHYFGKTLNISMVECFFSNQYENRGDLFEGLEIWNDEEMRAQQGKWPVLSLCFGGIKAESFVMARAQICKVITELYRENAFLLENDVLADYQKQGFTEITPDMNEVTAFHSLSMLMDCLYCYYGKKPILLLDECDTPMREAYIHGYWKEMKTFIRCLFNTTFKTNCYLERCLLAGITCIERETLLSDLNNVDVITTTSARRHSTSFGFTQDEVFTALDGQGLSGEKENVRKWYDGFVFGGHSNIYNPGSITNFLDTGKTAPYWTNAGPNALVSRLLQEGSDRVKENMEILLSGR